MDNKQLILLTTNEVSSILDYLNLGLFIDIYKSNEVDGNTLNACESVNDLIELGIKYKAKANVLYQKVLNYRIEGVPYNVLYHKKDLHVPMYLTCIDGYQLYKDIDKQKSFLNCESLKKLEYFVKHNDYIAMSFIARFYHYHQVLINDNYIDQMNSYAKQFLEFIIMNIDKYNDPYIFDNIGLFYQYGIGIESNLIEAMRYYQLAALQDNVHAQTKLGLYHLIGYYGIITSNPSESIRLLQNAILRNYPKAFYYLSICYKYGLGVEKNIKLSNTYQLSYIAAQLNSEFVVEDDYDDTLLLYQTLVQYKDPESLYELGYCYEIGKGVPIDYYKASDYYQLLVSNHKHANGYYRLGSLFKSYKDDRLSINDSNLNAFHYYYLSSLEQHIEGTYSLGICYLEGCGIDKDINEAIRYLWLASKLGSHNANYQLGICYKLGHGIKKNLQEAFRLLQLSSCDGNLDACIELGDWYQYGIHINEDVYKAFKYYGKALLKENGNLNSIVFYNIGRCYLNGIGVDMDELKGYQYCKEAADKGHAMAQYMIGMLLENGKIVPKNNENAFYYYQLASKQNNLEAICKLADCYLNGKGSNINYLEAFRLYQIASNSNLAIGQYNLGRCYQEGVGVEVDLIKAFELFYLSSNQDYDLAQKKLAFAYKDGIGIEKDLIKSFELFLILANKNYSKFQYETGRCYWKGIGVEIDLVNAIKYFQLAADNGHAIAQNAMGGFYTQGIKNILEKNMMQAFKYYQLSANQNYFQGLINLGLFYYNDILILKPDYYKAYECFQKAADQNDSNAQNLLGICYINGKGCEKNDQEAFKYFQLSANQNYHLGCFNLSKCYKYGIGIEKNELEAIIYKERAIEYGYIPDSSNNNSSSPTFYLNNIMVI